MAGSVVDRLGKEGRDTYKLIAVSKADRADVNMKADGSLIHRLFCSRADRKRSATSGSPAKLASPTCLVQ